MIQTAAGGTGLIAVQLAKHYGATIYATAGSSKKLDYLRSQDVPFCINYLEQDFEEEILRLTQGYGVDVVINTLSGDAIQKGMNCLAPGGRYIEIAMTALKSAKSIDLSVLNNNQSFYSVDLGRLGAQEPQTVKNHQKEMIELYEQKVIAPTICKAFSFEDIHKAYQTLADRSSIGKIVVTIPEQLQFHSSHSNGVAVNTTPSVSTVSSVREENIAIVGMSGRFAQSESLDIFWEHLKQGNDLVQEVTRWQTADLSVSKELQKTPPCHHGSLIDSIDQFDPSFFNISAEEALYMDPQQRLFLEETWKPWKTLDTPVNQ